MSRASEKACFHKPSRISIHQTSANSQNDHQEARSVPRSCGKSLLPVAFLGKGVHFYLSCGTSRSHLRTVSLTRRRMYILSIADNTQSEPMRLLNAKTKRLEEFFEKDIPPYAILSHTWGKDEVLFTDITKGRYNNDSDKIEGCCKEALGSGFDYVWIDTCCIDKRSSAELSEAINSMFDWYGRAVACYAYLADVNDTIDLGVPESNLAFRESKWWTRGWTLQELLDPRHVIFYNASWTRLGAKLDSCFAISRPPVPSMA